VFAAAELAARIDRAEAGFSAAVAGAVRDRGGADALVREIGGGLAAFARPGSPMNKLIGVGFAGALDDGELAAIEDAWRRRGEPVRVELSTLADPDVATALCARGYRLIGFENVLGRAVADAALAPPPPGVVVAAADDAAAERRWGEMAVDGFAHPDGTGAGAEAFARDVIAEVIADLHGARGVHRYLASIDGVAAGAATMRLDGGLAQLAGAATRPALRGRGVQAALLHHRLGVARRAGCDLAVVTTAPGSRSQRNVQRSGFALLYARAVLVSSSTR